MIDQETIDAIHKDVDRRNRVTERRKQWDNIMRDLGSLYQAYNSYVPLDVAPEVEKLMKSYDEWLD